MSDSDTIDPLSASSPVGRPAAAAPVDAARPAAAMDPVGAVRAVGDVTGVVAALGARLEAGELDRGRAMRALVSEVIARELPGLDDQSRERVVGEVVELLAEEPAWRARLDALWADGAR